MFATGTLHIQAHTCISYGQTARTVADGVSEHNQDSLVAVARACVPRATDYID